MRKGDRQLTNAASNMNKIRKKNDDFTIELSKKKRERKPSTLRIPVSVGL